MFFEKKNSGCIFLKSTVFYMASILHTTAMIFSRRVHNIWNMSYKKRWKMLIRFCFFSLRNDLPLIYLYYFFKNLKTLEERLHQKVQKRENWKKLKNQKTNQKMFVKIFSLICLPFWIFINYKLHDGSHRLQLFQ